MSEEKYYNLFDLSKEKLILKIKLLQQENKQLKDKINTYENPEDLTLMFMYCDEKAKDKIKQLKEVIEEVREEIEKSILIEGVRETGVGYYENIKVNKTKLLQILDKAKEMSNE